MSTSRPRSRKKAPKPVPVLTASDFVGGDLRLSIPMAGLLADQPELATVSMSHTDWQEHLDTYLASPRP